MCEKRLKSMLTRSFFGLTLLGLSLAAPTMAQARTTIQMGLNVAWPPDAMLALAVAKGFVPKQYEVHVQILQDPLTAYSLLASGKLDIMDSTADYVPVAVGRDLPIVATSMIDLSYGADQIVARPGINTAADIRGKRVAAPQAYLGELLMGLWLNKLGLQPSQISWVDLNATDAVGPLLTGKVKAAYLYEPWISKVLKNLKGSHVVATSQNPYYLKTGILGDTVYMNKDFVDKRKAAAEAMIKARFEALQYWHDHTVQANEFIAKFLKWPLADVRSVVGTNGKFMKGGVYLFDFDQVARYCGISKGSLPFGIENGQWVQSAKLTNRWWIKLGLLKQMHDVAKGIDCSLVEDLVKSGYHQSMTAK